LVIQRMAQLRAADPPMSRRLAAETAARELLTGVPSSHVERLRKKYAAREQAGDLPPVENTVDRRRREIQETLVAIESKKKELREQIAAKEQEAASLGLDTTNRRDLNVVLMMLKHERENCELILHGPPDIAIDRILAAGLSVTEADAQFLELAQRYEQVKKEEEVLREIVHLRASLGIYREVSTQKEEGLGEKLEKPG
jgi:hypothetical protein